jgi:galactokinase
VSGARLDTLLDISRARAVLVSGGISEEKAEDKTVLFERCARTLIDAGIEKGSDARAFYVPGRIEVLGKHTDYAGGRTLSVACEKGFCALAVPRDDSGVRVFHVEGGEEMCVNMDPDLVPAHGHWSNYPMTVVRRMARNFPGMRVGADVAFMSDLPPASGMSSSSAMMIVFSMILSSLNGLPEREEYGANITDMESLAGYLATIENGRTYGTLAGDKGVGTFGGSLDHTSILCCEPDHLSQYAYCPVRFEKKLRLQEDYVFAVGMSGVHAEKTGKAQEKYNRASLLAAAVAEAWRNATGREDPHIAAALASESGAADRMRDVLERSEAGGFSSEELQKRFEHFLAESEEIIPAAGDALGRGDIAAFGAQVDRSQELTETLLGNQVPETIFLARTAREHGAAAASAFGAGFGGSVWALVEAGSVDTFIETWSRQYGEKSPEAASGAWFFFSRPGPAAFELTM